METKHGFYINGKSVESNEYFGDLSINGVYEKYLNSKLLYSRVILNKKFIG
jgi:hypothetical protein